MWKKQIWREEDARRQLEDRDGGGAAVGNFSFTTITSRLQAVVCLSFTCSLAPFATFCSSNVYGKFVQTLVIGPRP
jgi:hypothetical protein